MVLLLSEDVFRTVCVHLPRYRLSPSPPSARHCCAVVVWEPGGRAPLFGYYLSGWNVSVLRPKMPDVGAFQSLRGLHAYSDLPAIWTLRRYFMGGGYHHFRCVRDREERPLLYGMAPLFSVCAPVVNVEQE